MDLSTITMPRVEARANFERYRRAARDRHSAEDKAIAAGYKAITEGRAVIELRATMIAGGVTRLDPPPTRQHLEARTVPRLAVGRADAKRAWTTGVGKDGDLAIATKRNHAPHNKRDVVRYGAGTFEHLEGTGQRWWGYDVNAMVPIVPPEHRPSIALGNFLILWEADWAFVPGPPPGDPALLRHIAGDLYSVEAVWDLTPLEQAVLAGRPLDA